MSGTVHREVVKDRDGVPRLTLTGVRRTKEDGLHIESLVYRTGDTDQQGQEPVADWVFPVQLRHDLSAVARLAVGQTRFDAPEETDR